MKRSFHKGSIRHGDDNRMVPAYFARCKCGASDFIATNGASSSIPEERLLKKFRARGWTITKQHEYCPACSRKGVPFQPEETDMNIKDQNKVVVPIKNEPRVMQPEDRRRIFRAIDERWDEPARRYEGLTTDKSLADDLHCPPAWVKEVREQSFGSFGTNEELESVLALLLPMEKEARELQGTALDLATKFENLESRLSALVKRIEKMRGG